MIEFQNVSFQYNDLDILKNFHITFRRNQISCLMGPSGVGKTTIANMMAKLIFPQKGQVTGIENAVYSYVFQEPRLLPWYSVYENIDFVLKDVYPIQERKKVVLKYLEMVGLESFRDYEPEQLSGGMAQRVSLARAFAYPSNVLIMDEPFKGLDMKLKQEMLSSFQRLWTESKRTVLFITHDIEEAISLSHEIYVLKNSPVEILENIVGVQGKDNHLIRNKLQNIHLL